MNTSLRFWQKMLLEFCLDCLTLEGGSERLPRNIGKELPIYSA
jgi:hypothetical protein